MSAVKNYLLLTVAVVNISTASIFVRLSGVHGFVAASWRLIISAFLTAVLLLVLEKRTPDLPGWRDFTLMFASGVFLALHFGLWMMSLEDLQVGPSVTIVDSYPALLAVVGYFFFRERYSVYQLLGAGIAFMGIALLSFHTAHGTLSSMSPGDPVRGAVLSFLGMIAVAMYFIIGKHLRVQYSTLEYTLFVYTIASIVSVLITLALGYELSGYETRTYLYLIGLAVFPMIGGHTIINYALGKLSLLSATIPILGEPVGASVLAWLILGESLDINTILYMTMTIIGIALTVASEGSK
jgi:drug/metabolite transporter (DMT)-like permease